MAKKSKSFGVNLPVPQNRDEAAGNVRRIGDTNREIARIEADLNDQIGALKEEAEAKVGPLRETVTVLTEGVKVWAEANRDLLTNSGRTKTADIGTGKVSWRSRPPSVRISGVDRVIEAIKKLGLAATFLRTREEVNKEALLADAEKARMISGVSIGSEGEDFIVEPFETTLAPALPVKAA